MNNTNLYHCTKIDSLKKIIDSKCFLPFYNLEVQSFMRKGTNSAYAMVCFADLPNENLESHMNDFNSDSYISMSKEWAINKWLSPVTYYTERSIMYSAVHDRINYCAKNMEKMKKSDDGKRFVDYLAYELAFMKEYSGKYYIKDEKRWSDEKRIFYNEREWRYVPFPMNGEAYYLTEEEYKDENLRSDKFQELIKKGHALSFEWKDILQVGVKKEDVDNIIDVIKNSFSIKESEVERKIGKIQML